MSNSGFNRVEQAPDWWNDHPQSTPYNSFSVRSVNLAPDEEVEWTWTYSVNGRKHVSGFVINKKRHK